MSLGFSVSIALLIASSLSAPAIAAEERQALIIANADYQFTARLTTPVNDADLIARVLQRTGFKVERNLNADKQTMLRAMLQFSRQLQKEGVVGLFYYAGHGIQIEGRNYLIPVDANIARADEVQLESIAIDTFLQALEGTVNYSSRLNLVILDACRDNPFARRWRSTGGGLAAIDAPSGTLIAFSTAPGDVASDGLDGNSPYASALARAMLKEGLPVEETFKRTRSDVLGQSTVLGYRQVPWEQSSLTGEFYFVPANMPVAQPVAETGDPAELVFWESVRDSTTVAELQAYLNSFPRGRFREIAAARINQLTQGLPSLESHLSQKNAPPIDPRLLPSEPPDYSPRHGEANN